LTTADDWPSGNGIETPVEQVRLGGLSSTTVTLKEQLGPSISEQETGVVPTTNTDPDGGTQVTSSQPSIVGEKLTTVPHDVAVGGVGTKRSGGQISVQDPEKTPVLEVVELLAKFGSLPMPMTVAELVITAPGAEVTLTVRVIGTDTPPLSGPREQVTRPVPPTGGVVQLPALASDTNVVPAGKLSVNRTAGSGSGPLFVTANV
jgi:hypothetical protein